MKKILIWTPIPVQRKSSAEEFLADDLYRMNSGNLLFVTSVVRTLMVDQEVQFEPVFGMPGEMREENIECYNAEYSFFAIPLANAFRREYIEQLEKLTAFVKRLRIPCVVIGVGIQAALNRRMDEKYSYDDAVKRFMAAVLEKSVMVGLRGRHTADYLTHLGFTEEKDFTVIGCPSMYMWGAELPPIRKKELNAKARICVNGKLASSELIHEWMKTNCALLPEYNYIPQRIEEFRMMGYGFPILNKGKGPAPKYLPVSRKDLLIREKRSVGFMSAYAWVDFMRNMDFAYGCNIHGSIAAVLAGTPCLTVIKDRRVEELVEYFEIPCVTEEDMRSGRSVISLYERADYGPMQRNHCRRFGHFVDFLNVNGVPHIHAAEAAVGDAPYDRCVHELGILPPYYPRSAPEILKDPGTYRVWGKIAAQYGRRLSKKLLK